MSLGPSPLAASPAPGGPQTPASHTAALYTLLRRNSQKFLDEITPFPTQRWAFTAVLGLAYMVRALTAMGWYIVTYALGIYLLNLFLAFITPKFDPALEEALLAEEEEGGPSLPTKQDDEFRPFIRRLPEFKFWFLATRSFIVAFACTLTRAFDLPVFWPILLMYFIILFFLTMRRQIAHMIRYKYVPWDFNKKQYRGSMKPGN